MSTAPPPHPLARDAGALGVAAALVLLAHAWALGAWSSPQSRPSGRALHPVAVQVRTLPAPNAPAPSGNRGNPSPWPDAPRAAAGPVPSSALAATATAERTSSSESVSAAGPAASGPPGSAADAPSPVPLYRTRLPPSGSWDYLLRRAGREGTAQLQWRHEGDRYEAALASGPGGAETLHWRSTGAIDAAGVAPERFVDRRDRRREAANFDRASGRIGYSGSGADQPLYPGSQDRLSLLLQLAAILEGRRTPAAMGEEVLVHVSGARGDAAVWRFEVQGPERVTLPDGAQRFALKLLREPAHPYDLRVEVWTDPAHHHLPLRVRMRNGGHEIELVRQGTDDVP